MISRDLVAGEWDFGSLNGTLMFFCRFSRPFFDAQVEDLMDEMMVKDGPLQHSMYVFNAR